MLPRNFSYAAFISFAQEDKILDSAPFSTLLKELNEVLLRNGHRNHLNQTYFLINKSPSGDFREELAIGKSSSVCLLSLYSPNYWDSPECATELSFFYARNLRSKYRLPAGRAYLDLFAVPWSHRPTEHEKHTADKVFPPTAPQKIQQLSYFRMEDQFPTIHRTGLRAALANPVTEEEGKAYVRALAEKISEVIQTFTDATPLPAKVGRKASLYVLAATPGQVEERIAKLIADDEIPNLAEDRLNESRTLRIEAYRFGGGADWHPFAPMNRSRSIRSVVEAIIKDDIQELASPVEPPGLLPRLVAEAEQRKEYVIVVVDPWSLFHFEGLRTAVSDLDKQKFDNCMLLVVRGPGDAIYNAQAEAIDENVRAAFQRSRNTSIFFRDITSEQMLRSTIRDLFEKMRKALGAEPARTIDTSGPLTLLTVSNSGRP